MSHHAEVFNNQPYNEKSDVFSFGTLAYELLAGELLIISIFNTGRADKMGIKDPQGYAARVRVPSFPGVRAMI